MKVSRDFCTNSGLNLMEQKWWDENAVIVSKVWEMHPEISLTVRKKYLSSAKEFFLKDEKNVTILELGCGSGWVGQSIAGPTLKIIGIDFSESQIQLAKSSSKSKGLEKYCEYVVSNSTEMDEMFLKVDGVLIHAFMHHLDCKEIDELLTGLKAKMKNSTKIWIYEPAFYLSPLLENHKTSLLSTICLNITIRILSMLEKLYDVFKLVDEKTINEFRMVTDLAANNGWYLSPKEIPFDVDAFSISLAKYFKVKKHNWATIYSIGWVFKTNLLKSNRLRKLLNNSVLPFICFTDNRLINELAFLQKRLAPPSYAFHVWYCIV